MSRTRKLLATLATVGTLGSLAAYAAFSAFSSSTTNPGNNVSTGTVVLSDNDAGAALYNLTNQAPNNVVQRCIKVSYTGSLDADVKLYLPGGSVGSLGPYVNLTVEKGTQASPSFPSCSGFTPQSTVYNGTLQNFAASYSGWSNGLAVYPGSQTKWNPGDELVFRFTVSVQDDNNAQGLTTGSHAFTWEARNQ